MSKSPDSANTQSLAFVNRLRHTRSMVAQVERRRARPPWGSPESAARSPNRASEYAMYSARSGIAVRIIDVRLQRLDRGVERDLVEPWRRHVQVDQLQEQLEIVGRR